MTSSRLYLQGVLFREAHHDVDFFQVKRLEEKFKFTVSMFVDVALALDRLCPFFYPVWIGGLNGCSVISEFILLLDDQLLPGETLLQLLDLRVPELLGHVFGQLAQRDLGQGAGTRPGAAGVARDGLGVHRRELRRMPEATPVFHGAVTRQEVATWTAGGCWGNPAGVCGARPLFRIADLDL